MQGKGFIKFMAVLLGLICLYALSFNFVNAGVEKDAKEFAKGDPLKEKEYLDSMANVKVYPVLGFTYQFTKGKEINLGLDLKGGMNVTMEISLVELVSSLAGNPTDPAFNTALQNAEKRITEGGKDFVAIFVDEFEKIKPGVKLADYFASQDNSRDIKANSSNADVQKFLSAEANSAIDRSFTILRSRIDGFGVVSPNMQKQEGSNRILIELPGIQDRDRVRKLLSGTAELQFWHVYQIQEVYSLLENIDKTLAASLPSTTVEEDSTKNNESKLASLRNKAEAKDSLEIQKNQLSKTNPMLSLFQFPLVQGPQGPQLNPQSAIIGYVDKKDTAKVNSYLRRPEVAANIPSNMKFMWSVKPDQLYKRFELYAIKITTPDGKPELGGEAIADSRNDFDEAGKPAVSMNMNVEGIAKWKKMTADASADPNNKRAIAIVLDNQVYTAPTVNGEIPNGNSSITGNFTSEDTKDLSNILKAGKLPAPAKIVGEYVVGPTLGQEAINNGLLSFVIAFVVILVFMALYYNKAGWVANLALLINLFFIFGILISLGAVLTLPGIAGIVLTIGLSVDANILIFERVREELAHGKSTETAIKDGFKHAMSSIIDSNATLFILGLILMFFGTGPIRGFATTLCIGILSSLFAAVLISRVVFDSMLKRKQNITFDNNLTRNAFKDVAINFVKHRKKYYIGSLIIILLGIGFYVKHGGFNLGIDFKGGRTFLVEFDRDMNTAEVKEKLEAVFGLDEQTEVKTAGGNNKLKITTTYHIADTHPNADKIVEKALDEGLKATGAKFTTGSSQKVTPIVANDILMGAYGAVIVSCILMFIYILIRFKKWEYGLGAIVALIHDVALVLSFYTILDGVLPFSLEIGQDFIAAILTVMGYTMLETVIVFDRIREKLSHAGKKEVYGEERITLINFALNSTLSRTILTSLTVLFVLLAIFIFGGDSIRGFIFALLIGRVIGTYSSLCISTPIVIDFGKNKEK